MQKIEEIAEEKEKVAEVEDFKKEVSSRFDNIEYFLKMIVNEK